MTDKRLGDVPRDPVMADMMDGLADRIDAVVNRDGADYGFMLMVFPLADPGDGTFVGNVNREDLMRILKEHIALYEAQPGRA